MIKFLGGETRYIIGIPARDLSAEDWAELTDEQRTMAVASDLYESAAVEAAIADAAPIEPVADVVEPTPAPAPQNNAEDN